jgi:hypothetical protein
LATRTLIEVAEAKDAILVGQRWRAVAGAKANDVLTLSPLARDGH